MSERQFTGKVAFVTGGTSGIGQACALAFATAGAKVVCVGRKAEALNEMEQKIQDVRGEALTIKADLSSEPEAARAVDESVRAFGGIDILVNAAGHISSGTV